MRYIGSKILLLNQIQSVVERHASGAKTFCDLFSGSACVARHFKQFFEVYSNDILYFSYCLQRGSVENDSVPTFDNLTKKKGFSSPIDYLNNLHNNEMEALDKDCRLFQTNLSPSAGRMYVTDENALRIDFARNSIEQWKSQGLLSDDEYYYLVASVIEGIPFISNIAGTYGAFYKTWDRRALKKFELKTIPVVSNFKNNKSYNENGIELLTKISGDVLYIDPPYNQRQYLPNYHVLETAAKYDFPKLHGVTGLRDYEKEKSDFCLSKKVSIAFDKLMNTAQFSHIIMSYSTDGLMSEKEIEEIMKRHGNPDTFELIEIPYRRYKCRTGAKKPNLNELLFYISK